MPIHDWTRVVAGTWHDMHQAWITELRNVLNGGLLPPPYYAQADQVSGGFGPDVLALEADRPAAGGGLAVAAAAPRARLVAVEKAARPARRRKRVAIRSANGDRVVALIELVSPGNKDGRRAFREFVNKAVASIGRGHHLLVVDLFPPTPRDPDGLHNAIWGELSDIRYDPPPDARLTLAAYTAGPTLRAYVEPTAVGRELIEMPLFLDPDTYINVPLEETYRAAYRGVPGRWKTVLDAP
jgi:Protein of unknown function (DUF4058)